MDTWQEGEGESKRGEGSTREWIPVGFVEVVEDGERWLGGRETIRKARGVSWWMRNHKIRLYLKVVVRRAMFVEWQMTSQKTNSVVIRFENLLGAMFNFGVPNDFIVSDYICHLAWPTPKALIWAPRDRWHNIMELLTLQVSLLN